MVALRVTSQGLWKAIFTTVGNEKFLVKTVFLTNGIGAITKMTKTIKNMNLEDHNKDNLNKEAYNKDTQNKDNHSKDNHNKDNHKEGPIHKSCQRPKGGGKGGFW